MRPRERRELERQAKCAAGDPRALLLAATPPDQRSEVAARYDHQSEAAELDTPREPTTAELDQFRIDLWRANVAVALVETTVYRDIVSRYMAGQRTSAGMDREIAQAEAGTEMPGDAECRAEWQRSRKWRRDYIRARYGC